MQKFIFLVPIACGLYFAFSYLILGQEFPFSVSPQDENLASFIQAIVASIALIYLTYAIHLQRKAIIQTRELSLEALKATNRNIMDEAERAFNDKVQSVLVSEQEEFGKAFKLASESIHSGAGIDRFVSKFLDSDKLKKLLSEYENDFIQRQKLVYTYKIDSGQVEPVLNVTLETYVSSYIESNKQDQSDQDAHKIIIDFFIKNNSLLYDNAFYEIERSEFYKIIYFCRQARSFFRTEYDDFKKNQESFTPRSYRHKILSRFTGKTEVDYFIAASAYKADGFMSELSAKPSKNSIHITIYKPDDNGYDRRVAYCVETGIVEYSHLDPEELEY